jgi:hypothetical protein
MSESSKRESEERALEALIVSQIWQERDPGRVDDLPELTDEERAAMDSLGTDLVQRLWNSVLEDEVLPSSDTDVVSASISDEAFAGMNRADEIDAETNENIEKRRKEVLDRLRKKKLDEEQNNA